MDSDRQMFKGDWTCSGCGGSITELPFEPRSTENLLCRDCHANKKGSGGGGGGGGGRERKMHQGSWECSSCNGPITELPFEPRETGNLMCKECFRKSKGLD